jgi:hypothetical protein
MYCITVLLILTLSSDQYLNLFCFHASLTKYTRVHAQARPHTHTHTHTYTHTHIATPCVQQSCGVLCAKLERIHPFAGTAAAMTTSVFQSSCQEAPAAAAQHPPHEPPAHPALVGSQLSPHEDSFLRYIKAKDIPEILKSMAAMEVSSTVL